MRFAGTRIEGLLGGDRPEYGALSQKALANRTAESTAATDLMGKTAATGISAAGAVEAANITGAAQASLANAQGQAAIMSGIGDIAGSAIGAFGRSKIGSYDDIPAAGLTGSAVGAGAGKHAYIGTGGKYGSLTPPTQNANGSWSFLN